MSKNLKIERGQKTKEIKRSIKHRIFTVDMLQNMLRSKKYADDQENIKRAICEVSKV